ncbi:hypothetical protein [Luteimicrobium subarcticum]|uniref:Uncharacterized protein n=1 Tax=Luteimicrobium subarcticum TaxID=620910 RepID=A0A2M8W3N9_9MICO|nr:hypothetical protein [Luteimicrobium subarcticum]PJI85535.1 hypothetical protein CLV34_2716 [Luteimicrobium subarcticum]
MDTMDEIRELRVLRARRDLAPVDYARAVRRLVRAGQVTQVELARELAVSQAAISKLAGSVEDVDPQFHGASPYEIAQRYAAGEIDRDRMIDELTRWPYDPSPAPVDDYDALMVKEPGSHTIGEVGRAMDEQLIDEDAYVQIARAVTS